MYMGYPFPGFSPFTPRVRQTLSTRSFIVMCHVMVHLIYTGSDTIHTLFLGAVHDVLFGEWDEFLCFLECLTFQWPCGRESPAWATLFLVLYWCDVSFRSPVDSSREICYVTWGQVGSSGCISHNVTVHHLDEFLVGLHKKKLNVKVDLLFSVGQELLRRETGNFDVWSEPDIKHIS